MSFTYSIGGVSIQKTADGWFIPKQIANGRKISAIRLKVSATSAGLDSSDIPGLFALSIVNSAIDSNTARVFSDLYDRDISELVVFDGRTDVTAESKIFRTEAIGTYGRAAHVGVGSAITYLGSTGDLDGLAAYQGGYDYQVEIGVPSLQAGIDRMDHALDVFETYSPSQQPNAITLIFRQ